VKEKLVFLMALILSCGSLFADFDWGGDCDAGNGSFSQNIPYQGSGVEVGIIPINKRNVVINLAAVNDVDIQLLTEDGHQIIAYPSGDLNGPVQECTNYNNVEYCYSGYNGVDGQKGHEFIRINGDTNIPLVMKAWGFQAGDAEVTYEWNAVPTCNEKGNGAFSQYIAQSSTTVVGDIPLNKVNVKIELIARNDKDVDIQLYDGDTAIVQWPSGILNGPSQEEVDYEGMTIIYSGYYGIDGNSGHETIEIKGRVTRTLTMKAYGYRAGTADITYEWGIGAGNACGGLTNPPLPSCEDGFVCKDGDFGNQALDIPGECHNELWCESEESAVKDCNGLIHPAVPGFWGCEEFTCKWIPGQNFALEGEDCGGFAAVQCETSLKCLIDGGDHGICRAQNYCLNEETAKSDCANLNAVIKPKSPHSYWGCEESKCILKYEHLPFCKGGEEWFWADSEELIKEEKCSGQINPMVCNSENYCTDSNQRCYTNLDLLHKDGICITPPEGYECYESMRMQPLGCKAVYDNWGCREFYYDCSENIGKTCNGRNPEIQLCGDHLECLGGDEARDIPGTCKKVSYEDEMCGGIAGFICATGLNCDMDGNYPDAAGTCRKICDSDSECTDDNFCKKPDYSCEKDGMCKPRMKYMCAPQPEDMEKVYFCSCDGLTINDYCHTKENHNVAYEGECKDPLDTGDAYQYVNAKIKGHLLIVDVNYSGGCANHEFDLNFSKSIMESYPLQINGAVHHNANSDACKSLRSDKLFFDLRDFAIIKENTPITINLMKDGEKAYSLTYDSDVASTPICEVTFGDFGYCKAMASNAWALIDGECKQISGCPDKIGAATFYGTKLECLNNCAVDSCEAWNAAFEVEFSMAQYCEDASECQAVPGTSCGCTRNLVVNGANDLTTFDAVLEGKNSVCEPIITTCDCPLADGFKCENNRCQWNYTN